VSIRPETIRLFARAAGHADAGENLLSGRISNSTFLGSVRRLDVASDTIHLQVTVAADLPLPADGEVTLSFAPERAIALPRAAT
jgi:hypothetical protein